MRVTSYVGLVSLTVTAGCVSEEELQAALAQRDEARAQVSKLEEELDVAKGRLKELEKKLSQPGKTEATEPPRAVITAAYSQLQISKGDKIIAVIKTSEGDVECNLFPHIAPNTVLNFVGLAEGTKEWTDPRTGQKTTQPLYDGTTFHRVIKGFMIQGGDPLGTGRGGPGYTFADEIWPHVRFDRPGLLAMANSGPDSNGSQFFITDARPAHLNGRHTIFGICELETVRKIMDVETTGPENSTPVDDVVISTVEIVRQRQDDE